MNPHPHFKSILKQLTGNGQRMTHNRRQVLEYLCTQEKPVSIKQLEKRFAHINDKINIVTLYRMMDFLIAQNIVRELTHDPKEKFFELADPYHEHHHHTICRQCGKVEDLECQLVIPSIPNFIPDMHVVTVYGHCQRCD